MSRPSPIATAAVIAALVTLVCGTAAAQTKTGTTMGQFLLIEPSARMSALGNAGSAAGAGLDGVYYNPAIAGRMPRLEVEFAHVDWIAGIRFDYVAAAIPFGSWGTGFATLTSLNSGEIDVRTVSQPLGTGERFSVSNTAIGLGYARTITDRFSAGIQIKYVQETVWHSSAGTVTFDVGTLYRIHPNGLHIGSSLSHFGTEAGFSGRDLRITYDQDPSRSGDNPTLPGEKFTQNYPVPVLFRVAVAQPWRMDPDWDFWTTLEVTHPNDNSESVSGGAEASWRDRIALRAGYRNLFKQDSEEGLALGTGIRFPLRNFDCRIDYAWAEQGRLGDVHRLALCLSH